MTSKIPINNQLNQHRNDMTKKQKTPGLLLNGSLKQSGVTFYLRNGQMIARSAHSRQPLCRTRAQFIARQQLSHSSRLWTLLKWASEPMFEGGATAYSRFMSLMRRTPVVFLPQRGPLAGATLLLPSMPVSDGVLPVVNQWLGTVDGSPALLTSLAATDLRRGDTMRFYTLRQCIEGCCPVVRISASDLRVSDFQVIDNHLALVDETFSDEMAGWVLVHLRGQKCSSQQVVTRCTYYLPFTTEEALLSSAASYGGLTDS